MNKKTVNYIMNILRQGTIPWSGRAECINRFSRFKKIGKYKNGETKYIKQTQCQHCKKWFNTKDEELEIDHVIEIGAFKGDWNEIMERMWDVDNLQPLCILCHKIKTSKFNATVTFKRKNKGEENDYDGGDEEGVF